MDCLSSKEILTPDADTRLKEQMFFMSFELKGSTGLRRTQQHSKVPSSHGGWICGFAGGCEKQDPFLVLL